ASGPSTSGQTSASETTSARWSALGAVPADFDPHRYTVPPSLDATGRQEDPDSSAPASTTLEEGEMRRRLMLLAAAAILAGLTAASALADGHFTDAVFDAQLSGGEEVPAVTTEGAGYVSVTLSEDGSSLDYRLYANGLVDMTMAHIHVGAEGENGPPLVFLFGPADPPMTSDGLLAEDTIVEADLIPVEGVFDGTMAQLIELIRSGNTYVNVHTAANPAGEIRGQL